MIKFNRPNSLFGLLLLLVYGCNLLITLKWTKNYEEILIASIIFEVISFAIFYFIRYKIFISNLSFFTVFFVLFPVYLDMILDDSIGFNYLIIPQALILLIIVIFIRKKRMLNSYNKLD